MTEINDIINNDNYEHTNSETIDIILILFSDKLISKTFEREIKFMSQGRLSKEYLDFILYKDRQTVTVEIGISIE